jgi:hypothetical protein
MIASNGKLARVLQRLHSTSAEPHRWGIGRSWVTAARVRQPSIRIDFGLGTIRFADGH